MKDPQLLVYGYLSSKPEERTDVRGKKYTVGHIICEREREDMRLFIISHAPKVGKTLQSLEKGGVVALSGALAIRQDKDGHTSVGITARKLVSTHPTVTEA